MPDPITINVFISTNISRHVLDTRTHTHTQTKTCICIKTMQEWRFYITKAHFPASTMSCMWQGGITHNAVSHLQKSLYCFKFLILVRQMTPFR